MLYGKIIWGNCTDTTKIFKMQKRAIRIITESKNRDSCRDLFTDLKILPFHSQYMLPLFVVDNKSMYNLNTDIHNVNTRQKLNFDQHSANLSLYQKGVHSFGIKNSVASLKVSKKQLVILSNLKQHLNITYLLTPSTP
jgi:hypothetical protein